MNSVGLSEKITIDMFSLTDKKFVLKKKTKN